MQMEYDETQSNDSDSDYGEHNFEPIVKVCHSAALTHTRELLKWCQENDKGISFISNLQKLREEIVKVNVAAALKEKKQARLTSFGFTSQ